MKTHLLPFFLAPLVCLAGLSLNPMSARAADGLQDGDNVAIGGDSITEQKMYSVFMEDYLLMCQPVPHVSAHQFGWGGETSWQYAARLKNDVLSFHPTVATTCYGMNDGGYVDLKQDRADKYKQAMEDIVKQLKAGGVRFIVLGSPGAVDPIPFKGAHIIHASGEVYNKTLGALGDIAKSVADENSVGFADVHGAFMAAEAKAKTVYGADYVFAKGDGIHPGPNGHLVMAYAFLKALGCTGDIGQITVDLTTGQTAVDANQKVVSSQDGTIKLTSSRYPFCFDKVEDPGSARTAIPLVPFNEELNKYMLTVKGLRGSKAKVTWGTQSKEYAAADLEKGVNLAADFLDNPFSEQFHTVQEAIKKQQNYETPAVKFALHSIPDMMSVLPEKKDDIGAIRDLLIGKANDLSAAAQQAVVPVDHTITIASEQ